MEPNIQRDKLRIETQLRSADISDLRAACVDLSELPHTQDTLLFAIDKLKTLLKHEDDRVVSDALATIRSFGARAQELSPDLFELYQGDDDELAAQVLSTLMDVGYSVEELCDAYRESESHPNVYRCVGLLGLGPTAEGDRRQIADLLIEAFDGVEEPIMDKAAVVAAKLPEFKDEFVPMLLEYLDSCRGLVNLEVNASKTLSIFEVPHGVSEKAYEVLQNDETIDPKNKKQLAPKTVVAMLFSENRFQIMEACDALTKYPIGDSGKIVERLEELLEINDGALIESVVGAIGAYGTRASHLTETIEGMLTGSDRSMDTLLERTLRRIRPE